MQNFFTSTRINYLLGYIVGNILGYVFGYNHLPIVFLVAYFGIIVLAQYVGGWLGRRSYTPPDNRETFNEIFLKEFRRISRTVDQEDTP